MVGNNAGIALAVLIVSQIPTLEFLCCSDDAINALNEHHLLVVPPYQMTPPIITKDPRFLAGRTLVKSGRTTEGAIDIFATLLEECIHKYGPVSLEAASCYYEYGNALLRASSDQEEVKKQEGPVNNLAAEAAERRVKENIANPAAAEGKSIVETNVDDDDGHSNDNNNDDDDDDDNDEDDDDFHLACEMMENAWSIIDQYTETNPTTSWILEQQPRILIGIADVLLLLKRYGDAVDAYTRALPLREAAIQNYHKEDLTVDRLRASRHVVEANVMIADALLSCPSNQSVITTETNIVLVTADEKEYYTQGYYDKARDGLQETVVLMGEMAAKGIDLGTEKEDVCFISTLLMGVGERLAEIEELKQDEKVDLSMNKKRRIK